MSSFYFHPSVPWPVHPSRPLQLLDFSFFSFLFSVVYSFISCIHSVHSLILPSVLWYFASEPYRPVPEQKWCHNSNSSSNNSNNSSNNNIMIIILMCVISSSLRWHFVWVCMQVPRVDGNKPNKQLKFCHRCTVDHVAVFTPVPSTGIVTAVAVAAPAAEVAG